MVRWLEQAVMDTSKLAVPDCLVIALREHGFGRVASGESARDGAGLGILGGSNCVQHIVVWHILRPPQHGRRRHHHWWSLGRRLRYDDHVLAA